jgi:hypothetical protein
MASTVNWYYDFFVICLFSIIFKFNFLFIHGTCSALALNVPCPYFVQEILIGGALLPGHRDQSASVSRLLIAADVSEQDNAFVRTVAGPEADEWWYADDPEKYPHYGAIMALIHQRIEEV